jgi:hypothetical protein
MKGLEPRANEDRNVEGIRQPSEGSFVSRWLLVFETHCRTQQRGNSWQVQ